jgi:hypothetical protein
VGIPLTGRKALGINIPVSARMISHMLNAKKIKYIKKIDVEINEPGIDLKVTLKIWKVEYKVLVNLIPFTTEPGRKVTFKIAKINPPVLLIIKMISFKKHDMIKLNKGYITLNFNGIKRIKAIKYGRIAQLVIRKKVLWCKIEMEKLLL